MDEDKKFYSILGNHQFSFKPYTLNPFTLYKDCRTLQNRLSEKKISGNWKGDFAIKGGLLLFSKEGALRLKIEEVVGEDLPYDQISEAVAKILVE